MKIRPVPGLLVRDPATMAELPPEGIEVAETDLHWARLLRDGDVVIAPESAAPAKKDAAE